MNKHEFETDIYNNVNLKLFNYSITREEIKTLTNTVYEEIASEINLMNVIQCVTIEDGIFIYDLDNQIDRKDNSVIGDVYKITDSDNYDISWYFMESCRNTFMIRTLQRNCFWGIYAGKEINFYRQTIPVIENLSTDVQIAIRSTVIAGVLSNVVDIAPAPTGSQVPIGESDIYKKRYTNEKYILLNKYPQFR